MCIKAIGRYTVPELESILEIVILFGICFGRMIIISTLFL